LLVSAKFKIHFGVNFGTLLIGLKKVREIFHKRLGTLFARALRFSVAVLRNDGGDLGTQYSPKLRNPASGLAENGTKRS